MKKIINPKYLLLVIVLSLTQLAWIVPSSVSAGKYEDVVGKDADFEDYLAVRYISSLADCFYDDPTSSSTWPKKTISTEQYNSFSNIFNDEYRVGTIPYKTELVVGHDIGDKNGRLTCNEVASKAKKYVKKIFGDTSTFLEKFYKPGSGGEMELRDNYKEIGLDLSASKFVVDPTIDEARIAIAFSKCYDEVENNGAKNITVDGVDFYLKDSKSDSEIAIGSNGRISNKAKCSDIAQKMEDLDLYKEFYIDSSLTTGTVRNNPLIVYEAMLKRISTENTTEEATEAVAGLLDPNVVIACLAAAGLPASNISLETVTDWLISGKPEDLNWRSSATGTTSATKEQADKALGCLLENTPSLEETISQYHEDLEEIKANYEQAVEEGAQGGNPEEDKCLASNDFVSWFICPILGFVDTILDKLSAAIQDWLRFDLETMNVGINGGGMHNAWNIFRSMATILIMVGFLLALVVKGVRGE